MIPGLLRSPLLIAGFCLCWVTIDVAAHASYADALEHAIVQCVESDMAEIDAPGAAVTVIDQGDVIFNRGFGFKREGDPHLSAPGLLRGRYRTDG